MEQAALMTGIDDRVWEGLWHAYAIRDRRSGIGVRVRV